MAGVRLDSSAVAGIARAAIERRHAAGRLTDAERDRLLGELAGDVAGPDRARRPPRGGHRGWWRRLLGR